MTDLAAPRRGAFSRGRDRRTERLPGMTPCQSLPTTLSAGALPPSSRAGSCGGGDGSGIRPFGSMDPRCGGGRSAREKALLIASCWRRIFRIPSAFCSVPMHTSGGPQGRRRAGTINDPGGPVGADTGPPGNHTRIWKRVRSSGRLWRRRPYVERGVTAAPSTVTTAGPATAFSGRCTRNHRAYRAGRNRSVRTVPTPTPPMRT